MDKAFHAPLGLYYKYNALGGINIFSALFLGKYPTSSVIHRSVSKISRTPAGKMTDPKLLASLAAVPIEAPIDPDTLETVLSKPPFVILPGSLNIRDVGAYAPGYIKPGLVYRSGTLDFIPEASRSLLRSQLGVSTVFDFRRRDEVKRRLCDVDGIQVISCPFQDGQVDNVDVDLAAFVPRDGEVVSKGYRDMYSVILEGYTTGYRKVFEALKSADRNHAVLFHCMGECARVLWQVICKLTGRQGAKIGPVS